MRVLQYLLSVILTLSVTATAYPMALVTYLFADSAGSLPWYLNWYQTPDAPLWGDANFRNNQGAGLEEYNRSILWQWRNPAQGLDASLGAWYPLEGKPIFRGNARISDVGGIAGWCLITFGGYFHLLAIIPPYGVALIASLCGFLSAYYSSWLLLPVSGVLLYGTLTKKCFHAEFGWRIQQIATDYVGGMNNPMTRQLVITCRLFQFGN